MSDDNCEVTSRCSLSSSGQCASSVDSGFHEQNGDEYDHVYGALFGYDHHQKMAPSLLHCSAATSACSLAAVSTKDCIASNESESVIDLDEDDGETGDGSVGAEDRDLSRASDSRHSSSATIEDVIEEECGTAIDVSSVQGSSERRNVCGVNYATMEIDELRTLLAELLEQEKLSRNYNGRVRRLTGLSSTLKRLREPTGVNNDDGSLRNRIILDKFGRRVETKESESSKPRAWAYHPGIIRPPGERESSPRPIRLQDGILLSDLPPPPPHPNDPEKIRKLIRTKMIRCKRCKNRFIEKNIYERHLRDKHLVEYIAFLIQQEEEIAAQRLAELEANRFEEVASGGFIPPENEVVAQTFGLDPSNIPLPGELSGGIPARFDSSGYLRQPKRHYKKKVSPQCPFCDKRYRNEVSLKKHFVKKHPEAVEFVQCLKCFKAIKSAEELPKHQCDLTFICFECVPMRNLCTESRLLNHRTKFHRGANSGFKCNLCSMKCLTPRKLRKHKKMAHVFTKTYQCHFCDELFTSEVSVTSHERIHTGIIKFECRICDFKCNRHVRMEEHQNEEHGYICSVCHHKCAEWGSLKDHTLQEHGGYLTSESNSGYIDSPRVWVMYKGE